MTAGARLGTPGTRGGPEITLPYLVQAWDGPRCIETVPVADDRADATADGGVPSARLLTGTGRRFTASARWTPVAAPVAHWQVALDVTCIAEEPVRAGLRVAIALAGDAGASAPAPDWLIPGLFYGENRPAASSARYPRFVPPGTPPDPGDPFAADHWSFRADRAATPVVLARGGSAAAALGTAEVGPLGEQGIGFAADRDGVELRLHVPYREEPVVYRGGPDADPPALPTHRWQPGERHTLTFRVDIGDHASFDRGAILRDLHAHGVAGTAPRASEVSRAEAARLAAAGLLDWHFRAAEAVIDETVAFQRDPDDPRAFVRGDRRAMHVGWLSGAPTAAALLAHGLRVGDDAAAAAGIAVLDAIAANRAPCGTFWGQWTAASGWTKGWTPGPDALHSRTLAEATLFMARALAVEEQRGADHPSWRQAVAANLAFVTGAQRPDGAIPSAWNGTTGAIQSWAGTGGLAWVPALLAGATVLEKGGEAGAAGLAGTAAGLADAVAGLVDAAGRAGAHYAPAVEQGALAGAPEDVDLGPTSEDGYVAVMAYVALATAKIAGGGPEAIRDRDRWTRLARAAADWSLTFRYTYDVSFDASTPLGRIGYRTRGADQASPANQHLHGYGLVCLPEMVRLTALTGDRHYLERSREHLDAMRQGIARVDGEFGARRGMAPERYYQTDYDGSKGDIGPLSHAWCLGLLLWAADAAADIPELAHG